MCLRLEWKREMRIDPFCALLRFLAPYVQFDSFWSINSALSFAWIPFQPNKNKNNSALSFSINQQKKTYLDFEQIDNIRV